MANRPTTWHPTEAEVERMVAEMRPLLAELARQARLGCTPPLPGAEFRRASGIPRQEAGGGRVG